MFYLIHPRGFLNLAILEEDIKTRFIFLFKIIQQKQGVNIKEIFQKFPDLCSNLDSLIEGSKRDCASHFIFRLACCHRRHIQDYWVDAEAELFRYRLECSSGEMLYNTLLKLKSDINKNLSFYRLSEEYQGFLQKVLCLVSSLLHKSNVLFCSQRRNCNHYLDIPWILVQKLVSKREVELRNGLAKLCCHQLFDLLTSLFREFLFNGFDQLKMSHVRVDDIRVLQLIKSIHSYFLNFFESGFRNLDKENLLMKYSDVERDVFNFPLCMQQLHFRLKKFHRLSHHERFRYSLFLKDAGLPLKENINFWRYHYSHPSKHSDSGCQHSWSGNDAKRYTYSIRHMYGVEGKRVSYSSYTCSAIQAMTPQPMEAGGCPFRNLAKRQLNDVLSSSNFLWPRQRESVLKAAEDGFPSLACSLYQSALLHTHLPKTPKLSRFASYSSPIRVNYERRTQHSLRRINSSFENFSSPSGSPTRFSLSDHPSGIKRRKLESSNPIAINTIQQSTHCQSFISSSSSLTHVKDSPQQSCLSCNFDVLRSGLTFFTPIDYFTLTKSNNLTKGLNKRKQF